VADLPTHMEEALTLRHLHEGRRDGERDWIYAANHGGRIGTLEIVEFAGNKGERGMLLFTPLEAYERKGQHSVARTLRQQFGSAETSPPSRREPPSARGEKRAASTEQSAGDGSGKDALAETAARDFQTYCVEIAKDPEDIRSAARAAGFTPVPEHQLDTVLSVPGQAWVIRESGSRSILTLDTRGRCAIRFLGVPIANLRRHVEETLSVSIGIETELEGVRSWATVVRHRGQIGMMFLREHMREPGKPISLEYVSVESYERSGNTALVRLMRELTSPNDGPTEAVTPGRRETPRAAAEPRDGETPYTAASPGVSPATTLVSSFLYCIEMAEEPERLRDAARDADWPPISEDRLRGIVRKPGPAWAIPAEPTGAILVLTSRGDCSIYFRNVPVPDVLAAIGEEVALRARHESAEGGTRRWRFIVDHEGHLGSIAAIEHTAEEKGWARVAFVSVEKFERRGAHEAARWLREQADPERAHPAVTQSATPAKAVVDDFRTYCVELAANPDDVRAAARSSDLAPFAEDKLSDDRSVWLIRRGVPMTVLTLNSRGVCGVRFIGVPVADVRQQIEQTLIVRGPNEKRDGEDLRWIYSVNHDGHLGLLRLVEYGDGGGEEGELIDIPIEAIERQGNKGVAKWLREQFEE